MKYFIDAKARTASGHENYIEFQIPEHKAEFWDNDSLYMSEAVLSETGFRKFWTDCMYNDIVFDMDTISKEEMQGMTQVAQNYGNAVLDVLNELKTWTELYLREDNQVIGVVWEYERILSKRRMLGE